MKIILSQITNCNECSESIILVVLVVLWLYDLLQSIHTTTGGSSDIQSQHADQQEEENEAVVFARGTATVSAAAVETTT
jgi:hypothetical protein